MMSVWLHLCISKQQKLKTKVAFLKLILLKYIILFFDEGLLRNEKHTNNNKNSFVGSRTGVGPRTKTGVIYRSAVMHMYVLPWAIPCTIEMVLPASNVYVSSSELYPVP